MGNIVNVKEHLLLLILTCAMAHKPNWALLWEGPDQEMSLASQEGNNDLVHGKDERLGEYSGGKCTREREERERLYTVEMPGAGANDNYKHTETIH